MLHHRTFDGTREVSTERNAMSYEDAEATKMLATQCCVCGRPLLDATSVEVGMGPICRERYLPENSNPNRGEANKIINHCANNMAHPSVIEANCEALRELGFEVLADTIASRMELKSRVIVTVNSYERLGVKGLLVTTPFRRKATATWRQVFGRKWLPHEEANFVPRFSAQAVIRLLDEHFPGYIIKGDYFAPEHFAPEEDPPF